MVAINLMFSHTLPPSNLIGNPPLPPPHAMNLKFPFILLSEYILENSFL